MITIQKPYIQQEDGWTKLVIDVNVDGEKRQIWVSVEKKYEEYLCYERSDAVLIGLLSYALRHKHDIVCEAPVTDELLYNINEVLLPALLRNDDKNHSVKIYCETAECIQKTAVHGLGGVGTGLSCGVDSFHAVAKHYKSPYKSNALTHLAIYNNGSFNGIYRNSGLDYVRQKTWERAEKVANELSLPIVMVNSNIHKTFPQNHYLTNTYTDIFAVYVLQKLWKTYYYASGYDYSEFKLDNNLNIACAHFDILLCDCFSTSEIRLYSEGASETRNNKILYISDFEPARKNLHVCTAKEINCGHCEKCMRTLMAMDALGKLDDFREAFDIEEYKMNRSRCYNNLCKQYALGDFYAKLTLDMLYDDHKEEFDKYLSEYTLEKQIRRAEEQQKLVNIWRAYTTIFEKRIDKTRLKEELTERFVRQNVKTIAFYGDGELRRFLYSVINEIDDVEVKYIVEDGKFDWLPFPSYKRTDIDLPAVDLMIITDVLAFPAIKRMVERDYSYNTVTAEELITGQGE